MGVLTNDSDVWLSVWTGTGWVNQTTATTISTGTNHPAVAVAFEATTGRAIATYGEIGKKEIHYRTWLDGTGWSIDIKGPSIVDEPNSMMLYSEPGSPGVVVAAQDVVSDLHYLYWDGTAWGADNELETNSGETKNQPFLFLWEGVTGSPPPTYAISGMVFEDIAGDVLNDGTVGDASNPGVENTDVHLYLDVDDDGIPEATDTFVTTVQTGAGGDYSFPGLSSGKYFVVVDSKTVRSTALATSYSDIWAEQTYGPAWRSCADGLGGTVVVVPAGPCYGGRRAGTSDDLTTWYSGTEHLAIISVAGADVNNVDYGFSFSVVTTTAGGDAQDDDPAVNLRSVQGSLRQSITNANTITGANAMRFVPAEASNTTDGTNYWWRIAVTDLLPTVTDDDTTIDGRAFDFTDGATVLDTNTAQIGAGVAVGTEGTYTTPTLDPELEIWNNRGMAVVATGLVFEANNSSLRHVSIWGFGDSASSFDTNVRFGTNYGVDPDFTGTVVEFNVIGTGPASFADPGAGNRSGQKNLTVRENDNAIVRDNLIGFAGGVGVDFNSGSNSGTVLRNEVRSNGILNPIANPVGVWVSGNVTGNLITDNAAGVFSGPTLWITYQDNTITGNGWGGTRPHGIWVSGSSSTIRRNVVAGNAGAGVVVE